MQKGRPTRYRPQFAEEARHAYAHGACDEDVARRFEIGASTLYRWRNQYPEFAAACVVGKAHADTRVELSLYQRAIGFDYVAERSYMPANGTQPVVVQYQRRVLGEWRAALQWLRIRRPGEWRIPPDDDGRQELANIIEEAFLRVADTRRAEGRPVDGYLMEGPADGPPDGTARGSGGEGPPAGPRAGAAGDDGR